MGVGFVVGLVTGLVVTTWVWKTWDARKSGWREVRWLTGQFLLLPAFWLGGFTGGWATANLAKVIHLREFVGWYLLSASTFTAICIGFPVGRFITAMGKEIGSQTSVSPGRRRPLRPSPSKSGPGQFAPGLQAAAGDSEHQEPSPHG